MAKTDKAAAMTQATFYSMSVATRESLKKSKAVPEDWPVENPEDGEPAAAEDEETEQAEETQEPEPTPAPKAAAKAAPKAAAAKVTPAPAATKAATTEPETMGPADRYMVLVNQTAQKLKGLGVSVEVKYNF